MHGTQASVDDHHGFWQLIWAVLVILFLGGIGASYYLMNNPEVLETTPEKEANEVVLLDDIQGDAPTSWSG